MKIIASTLIALILLSGCGFRPLYQNTNTVNGGGTTLDIVEINDIPNAIGQAFKNALIDRFYHNGYPQSALYILKVSLEESGRDIIIQKNDTTTRSQLVLRATYELINKQTRQLVEKGSVRSVSSYNILPSQYTTLVTQNDAREKNTREAADKITLRIAVVLENQSK